jgi:hypothetical protein
MLYKRARQPAAVVTAKHGAAGSNPPR